MRSSGRGTDGRDPVVRRSRILRFVPGLRRPGSLRGASTWGVRTFGAQKIKHGARVNRKDSGTSSRARIDQGERGKIGGEFRRSFPVSYQIWFRLPGELVVRVGALGECRFPAGVYVYTGSARNGPAARVARHLRGGTVRRWHIDYLLRSGAAQILDVRYSPETECVLNQSTPGEIVVPGFGASDCRSGCGAHLKRVRD